MMEDGHSLGQKGSSAYARAFGGASTWRYSEVASHLVDLAVGSLPWQRELMAGVQRRDSSTR